MKSNIIIAVLIQNCASAAFLYVSMLCRWLTDIVYSDDLSTHTYNQVILCGGGIKSVILKYYAVVLVSGIYRAKESQIHLDIDPYTGQYLQTHTVKTYTLVRVV